MGDRWNELQWDGEPGHYEVYYLTFTDPASGIGFWIRYTMVAPLPETGEQSTCSLWFLAMDPSDPSRNVGEKASFPVSDLSGTAEPFELRLDGAVLTDEGMSGAIEGDAGRSSWDLRWAPRLPAYGHVHPVLRAAKIAKTILFLPHPDVEVSGTVEFGGRRFEVNAARGGQAHLWGSKHANRWAWAHCNDFVDGAGNSRRDTFVDGVSVFVPRFGREIGPNTPVVARVGGEDIVSISPLAVQRNGSSFDLDQLELRGAHAAPQARRPRERAQRGPGRRHLSRPGRRSCLLLQHRGGRHATRGIRALGTLHELAQAGRGALRPARALRVRAARAACGCRAEDRVTSTAPPLASPPFGWRTDAGVSWIEARLPAAVAVFSTRLGGVSAGAYRALNLGILTDDDPELVRRNRTLLASALDRDPAGLALGRQVHGAGVEVRRRPPPKPPQSQPAANLNEADAQLTDSPDVTPMVLVADCVPLVLSCGSAIGAVHCGWRGVAADIIDTALGSLCALGDASPREVSAVIGPGIGPCCYEVGEEVASVFRDRDGGQVVGDGRLDLALAIRSRLERAGVPPRSIASADICTSCHPELFFSHRRDGGVTGRQAGLAWLRP